MDIQTQYMGRTIKSPIIAGSCGKTNSVENIKKLEQAGAGAVILKSLFEEQISKEASNNAWALHNAGEMVDAYTYIAEHTKNNQLEAYLNLIKEAKKAVSIPVIASVNCVSSTEWMQFATAMEKAGADGLELNMFIMPSNVNVSAEEVEQIYENIIQTIRRAVQLPISLKISSYSASLAKVCQRLSWMGISTLSIFNRFMEHDIDIDEQVIRPVNIFSAPSEIYNTIRWTAILSKLVNCPITAGGGVHKEDDIIKLLLAGANTVQVASALYTDDFSFITKANEKLQQWMEEKHYHHINDFRGKLAIEKNSTVSPFYRVQYMKYYSGIE
ncbi:MAG: dihydroorotate dehydrogenase-like protein [Bacteroidales bacterium]|nr:dihydroorotate dehydrogenase-like protein [Bacteroidales bacterium]